MNLIDLISKHPVPVTRFQRPYVIAEAGVNHEGSMDIARRLIDEAALGGADAIKFQTYKAGTLASKHSPAYWDTSKEPTPSQYELFKKHDSFWKGEFENLKKHCDQAGIAFMSTPFDVESAKFLNDMMDVFKISSSDLTNRPFIEFMCDFKKPIIMSTGAASLAEIAEAVSWIEAKGNPLALLHCVLNYPTMDENAALGMIPALVRHFPQHVIGYSDHTLPNDMKVLEVAALLGAQILEKHFSHDKTLPGKLPQRKLCQTAAAGYSSYGNQIGLATGHVAELYHEGYVAKRLECGAVVAAAPASNVVRERPAPGDVVILLGGRTGRDGIGGATGSSKSHDMKSLSTMASEVQKGNAPEERKIQRLFRDGAVTRLIKRCNDFGAGGVSVAVGELADGLIIDLDAVRKKYEGLDGTELAISESQERMAVVVAPENEAKFIAAAAAENLEAYRVAVVTESPRMVMRWRGQTIADLSRAFLDTNGATKHASIAVPARECAAPAAAQTLRGMAGSLKSASRRGLVERFDSTVGAGTLLLPFGGRTQRSPAQAMAALLPVLPGEKTAQGSVMAWGCDPDALSADPYRGAHDAVYTSVAKLVAAGADYHKAYLSLQEFFEKLRNEPARWGKPFAALLGALDAQLELSAAAIGGKDSMSGTFLDLDVPPTLISFAIAPLKTDEVLSTEFKAAGHPVYLFSGADADGVKTAWEALHALARSGKVRAAWAVENGLSEAVMNMSFGNEIGFSAENTAVDWNALYPGAIVAELTEDTADAVRLGVTTAEPIVRIGDDSAAVSELLALNEGVLESVYPSCTAADTTQVPVLSAPAVQRVAPKIGVAVPKVLIPVFPGTNCEYDSARAVRRAGLEPEILVLNNQSAQDVADSISRFAGAARSSQIIFVPGGFSGGDEPDGSAKFITAFFRNPEVRDATMDLLKNRDGLMLGICNGFQALIKLGLVPYGRIMDTDESFPTLTYNVIGRHQSKLVRTRVCSTRSPWLAGTEVGDIYTVPISHGEGRFLASRELIEQLAANGQIATQYAGLDGYATMDTAFNPNGSVCAIEGITSPDGRVFGKMGHSERIGPALYRNVPGTYNMHLFASAVRYFKK